jgi:glycine oxidase
MPRADVAVIGGGVVGCAVGYALAREGLSVVLVERDRIAAHASRAAAGMLAPITESLLQPLAYAEPIGFDSGIRSLELFPPLVEEIRELSGIDPQLAPSGLLRAAHAEEADGLREGATRLAELGCEWLEAEEAHKREPRLAAEIAGAVWSPREAHVDSFLLTRALAAAAARRGASFELGTQALGLLTDGDRAVGVRTGSGRIAAAEVVLCTGAWTRLAGEWAGAALPVEPIRGQMLSLEAPQPPLDSIVWGRRAYVVPRRTGNVLVGATVEEAGFEVRTTASGVASLLLGCFELLPDLTACSFRDAWAGLRPATPDRLPLIGPVPGREGLAVAAGHYRNGVLLAPLTARLVADWIVRRERSEALRLFDPARFV